MKPLFMHKHAQLSSWEKLVCLVHFFDRELSITVLETEVVWFLLHTYWHLNLFCFVNLHHIKVQVFITLVFFFPISMKVRNLVCSKKIFSFYLACKCHYKQRLVSFSLHFGRPFFCFQGDYLRKLYLHV